MKKLLILLPTFVFLVSQMHARAAGAVLKHGFGANATGLGGAYGAIVKDPSALYWNPAGLAHINGETRAEQQIDISKEAEKAFDEKFEEFMAEGGKPDAEKKESQPATPAVQTVRSFEMQLYGTFSQLSLDRQMAYTGIGFTAPGGSYGVGVLGTRVTGIDGYDSTGAATGSVAYQSGVAFLGYARDMGAARVGFSGHGLYETIGGSSLNGGGLNVGAQVTPFPLIDLGFDVQNIIGFVQTQASKDAPYEKMDSVLRFSMAVSTPPPSSSIKLLLGFQTNLDDRETEGFIFNIGLAIGVTRNAYIMGGFQNGNFGGGIGAVFFNRLRFAYAVNRDPLGIDFQHSVEFNLKI